MYKKCKGLSKYAKLIQSAQKLPWRPDLPNKVTVVDKISGDPLGIIGPKLKHNQELLPLIGEPHVLKGIISFSPMESM